MLVVKHASCGKREMIYKQTPLKSIKCVMCDEECEARH
jgi:hypothetical protein